MRRLSSREKIIVIITAVLVVCFGIYYGFLAGFIEQYQEVSLNLERARKDYNAAKSLLAGADKIDRQYMAIAASLPTRQPGKSSEAVFTEQVDTLFRGLEIVPQPLIKPAKDPERVLGAPGYFYLTLPVEGIRGDLNKIVSVFTGLYKQNFLIQSLTIKLEGAGTRNTELLMNVDVAQIVRAEDLGLKDEANENESGKTGNTLSKKGAGEIDQLEKE